MIRLYVQDYCGSCCDFEPDVTKPVKETFSDSDRGIVVVQSDTIVRCAHAKRCESIRRYLKQQMESESKKVATDTKE